MIVMAGEFGRTVGALTGAAGRDHFRSSSLSSRAAASRAARSSASTDATGANIVDFGWSRQRP